MNKAYCLVVFVIVVLAIISTFAFYYEGHVISENKSGGHNCLTASGFYWNESELACVRDLPEGVVGERFQVYDFRSCVYAGYGIMESHPKRCMAPRGEVFFEE